MAMDTLAECRATFAAAEAALTASGLNDRYRLQSVGMCDDRITCAVVLRDRSSGAVIDVHVVWDAHSGHNRPYPTRLARVDVTDAGCPNRECEGVAA